MPLDPSIPLQTQPVQVPNLLNSAAQLMALRNSSSELALRQAQIQQANANTADIQAQAQQRARDVADQNTVQQAMSDPTRAKAFGQGDFSSLQGQISPASYYKLQQNHADAVDKQQTLTKDELANQAEARKQLIDGAYGLLQLKNDDGTTNFDAINDNLQNFIGGHAAALRTLGIDPSTLGAQRISDEKGIQTFISHLTVQQGVAQKALDQKEQQEKTAASAASAAKDTAEGKKAELDAQKTQLIVDQLKSSLAPKTGQHPVDAVLDPKLDPQGNAALKNEYDHTPLSPGDDPYAGKNAVLAKAAERALELSPATRQVKAQQAADTATATEQAHAAMGSAGFSSIVDPGERARAEAGFQKVVGDYMDKATSARNLESLIDQAQQGNKAAPGLIPIADVRQFANRVNANELRQVSSGAGDAADRFLGFVKGYTAGQPIPPAVLADMKVVAQNQEAIAKHAADLHVLGLKATYPKLDVKVPDIPDAPAPKSAAASALPARLSQSDVGRVFYSSKLGRNIKITAVNPSDPTQFKKEDQ